MIKKTLTILSVGAAFYASAQDVTTIRNSYDVYSTSLPGSAKYNAMAGAMGALGGDISIISTNPAGLGVAIASDISGTLHFQNSKNTTTLFGTSNDYSVKNTDLGQIGGLAAFSINNGSTAWKFVNVGVNYSSKSIEDYSESFGSNNISFDLGTDAVSFNRHAYDRTGTVTKVSLGVGGNYDNRIYVGGAVNVHGAIVDQMDTAELTYASNNTSEFFSKQYTPYSENASGFSASVGVIGKVNNQFRIGAAIETPTWWKIDRGYTYYTDSADEVYSETRKLQTQLKATVSAAFVPSKNFALDIDYTVGLTKPKYTGDDSALNSEFENLYTNHSKTTSEVKVGAEYRVLGFRLRGGYAFATNPFDNITLAALASNNTASNVSYSNLYGGKRNTVGVGLGYDFKSFYIDAAYNNISSEYASPFLRGNASAGSQYFSSSAYFANSNAVVSNVKNVQNNVSVTVGWKF